MRNTSEMTFQEPLTQLVRPAIQQLILESRGEYRCERELHHHLTTCLSNIGDLRLGTSQRLVWMEKPTRACYGSGRLGNLDYFFPVRMEKLAILGALHGLAMEVNCGYPNEIKIQKDMQKLIDPDSHFTQMLYFAYGKGMGFYERVIFGIERAFNDFAGCVTGFRLPIGLNLLIVEFIPGVGHCLHESSVTERCAPGDLIWTVTRTSLAAARREGAEILISN